MISLDAGKISATLANTAYANKKDGFVLDARGWVQPTNAAARVWLEMGVFDDLERQGTRTYQGMMANIVGLSGRPHRYVLQLTDEERSRGRAHLQNLGVDLSRPIMGLNTGAGRRWELKQWREEGYIELIERVAKKRSTQFLLLGGPEERARHERLTFRSKVPLIDAGSDNPVQHFSSLWWHVA